MGESPETSVRVAVFRANARVHDERSNTWDGEHLLLDNELAACNHQVRLGSANELFDLWGVRRMRADDRRFHGRIALAEGLHLAIGPLRIRGRKKELVEKAKGEDVKKTQCSDTLVLALHAPLHLIALLFKDDDAN